jgi:hypothetical protein
VTDPAAFAATRGYRPFDADNHYYEALDASPATSTPATPRVFEWAKIGKRSLPGARRHGLPRREERHLRPGGAPRRAGRLLPGQPQRRRSARAAAPPRAHPPRVPRPRRPPGRDGRAGHRAVLDVPHARHDLRGAPQARPRSRDAHVHRLQPLARRGLGLRLPGPDLRRAVRHAGRRRLGVRRAGVGARARRPHHRHPPGRRHHRRRAEARPATRCSTRSGPG